MMVLSFEVFAERNVICDTRPLPRKKRYAEAAKYFRSAHWAHYCREGEALAVLWLIVSVVDDRYRTLNSFERPRWKR